MDINAPMHEEVSFRRFQTVLTVIITAVLALTVGGVLLGQILLPSEQDTGVLSGTNATTLDASWTQVFKDGSTAPATVPSTLQSEDGTVTVEAKLPAIYDNNYFLCFRCSQEDAEVYVGGQLRLEYSTKNTRPFGTNSVSRYVFVPLSPADSAATVRIQLTTLSPMYAGMVNEVLYGDGFNIWYQLIADNALTDLAAIIVMILGLVAIALAAVLRHAYKRSGSLGYLGLFIACAGLLTFFESRIRQLYFPNLSATDYVTGIMLFLLVLSPMLFLNRCQNGRYLKVYRWVAAVNLLALAVCVVLQVTSTMDMINVFPELLALTLLTTFLLVGFVIRDFIKGYARHYWVEAVSYLVLSASFLGEMFILYALSAHDRQGIILCLGSLIALVLMLFAEVMSVVRRETLHEIEERENAQRLMMQTVTALSSAVDAKDAYTNGHASRVAEYSREIARRCGKDESYQQSVFAMGLLHDVGKIGIPSAIINKPDRLTDDENDIMNTHCEKGYAVLSNITEAPELALGALHHHERFDGTGYPSGLAGEDIPEKVRILAVADVYDAMTSNRSYRSALPQDVVRTEIQKVAGTQLDPVFARIMLDMIDEDTDYQLREK